MASNQTVGVSALVPAALAPAPAARQDFELLLGELVLPRQGSTTNSIQYGCGSARIRIPTLWTGGIVFRGLD